MASNFESIVMAEACARAEWLRLSRERNELLRKIARSGPERNDVPSHTYPRAANLYPTFSANPNTDSDLADDYRRARNHSCGTQERMSPRTPVRVANTYRAHGGDSKLNSDIVRDSGRTYVATESRLPNKHEQETEAELTDVSVVPTGSKRKSSVADDLIDRKAEQAAGEHSQEISHDVTHSGGAAGRKQHDGSETDIVLDVLVASDAVCSSGSDRKNYRAEHVAVQPDAESVSVGIRPRKSTRHCRKVDWSSVECPACYQKEVLKVRINKQHAPNCLNRVRAPKKTNAPDSSKNELVAAD